RSRQDAADKACLGSLLMETTHALTSFTLEMSRLRSPSEKTSHPPRHVTRTNDERKAVSDVRSRVRAIEHSEEAHLAPLRS
ncbi:hypothetical protein PENTCL1PPCAC_8162, partial [Pristionchus entomophagus]